jgi:uncharacterized protein (DUF736 family)
MAYEPKDNTGVIFKNKNKTEEKHPDYTGSAVVDGVKKDLSAWVKKGEKGKFLSIAIRDPYVKSGEKAAAKTSAKSLDEDDDLPDFLK